MFRHGRANSLATGVARRRLESRLPGPSGRCETAPVGSPPRVRSAATDRSAVSPYNSALPRGTGVSVTRWSPKPQRQVRFLGPPLKPSPGFPGFLAFWSRLWGDVVGWDVPHRSAGIRSNRSLSIPRAIPRESARRGLRAAGGSTWADRSSGDAESEGLAGGAALHRVGTGKRLIRRDHVLDQGGAWGRSRMSPSTRTGSARTHRACTFAGTSTRHHWSLLVEHVG
jgi:hypothetical protein